MSLANILGDPFGFQARGQLSNIYANARYAQEQAMRCAAGDGPYMRGLSGLSGIFGEYAPPRLMRMGDLDDESLWWDQVQDGPGPREAAYGDIFGQEGGS